jgi:NAD(P)-dependent dehydrogenase (short-subunit alcohol dehydrogenase family)
MSQQVSPSDPPPLDLRFDGQVVWVTGASRGLGRSIALALADAGADLMLSARSEDQLREVAAEATSRGVRCEFVVGSSADRETVDRTVERIESTWGRLDVLINNAAIASSFKPSDTIKDSSVRDVLEVNLVGPFICCQAALPLLDLAAGSSIVNVSSIHGTKGQERVLDYSVSKGGIEMLTRTLAVEWAGRGIRVNSLAPGYIETDMTAGLREHPRWNDMIIGKIPMGRFATTGEIVACALFLASPISSYVTGATLFADGGWSAR